MYIVPKLYSMIMVTDLVTQKLGICDYSIPMEIFKANVKFFYTNKHSDLHSNLIQRCTEKSSKASKTNKITSNDVVGVETPQGKHDSQIHKHYHNSVTNIYSCSRNHEKIFQFERIH